jgi:peptide/nickel transport system permease protein
LSIAARVALVVLAIVYLVAMAAAWLAPHDPAAQFRDSPWLPPGSPGFLLGTDGLGRDQWSRLLVGAQRSLLAGTLAAGIAVAVGGTLGGLAALSRGWPGAVVLRAADLTLAVPWTYALLAIRALLPLDIPPDRVFWIVMALLGLVGWPRAARLAHSVAIGIRDRDYVLASRGFGATPAYVFRSHFVPEMLPPLGVHAVLATPQYVLAEATLTFLGLGFSDTHPSWGNLLAAAARLDAIMNYTWTSIPFLVLAAVMLCYHSLGVSLAQRWKPGATLRAVR